jgi:hypothetical protein
MSQEKKIVEKENANLKLLTEKMTLLEELISLPEKDWSKKVSEMLIWKEMYPFILEALKKRQKILQVEIDDEIEKSKKEFELKRKLKFIIESDSYIDTKTEIVKAPEGCKIIGVKRFYSCSYELSNRHHEWECEECQNKKRNDHSSCSLQLKNTIQSEKDHYEWLIKNIKPSCVYVTKDGQIGKLSDKNDFILVDLRSEDVDQIYNLVQKSKEYKSLQQDRPVYWYHEWRRASSG